MSNRLASFPATIAFAPAAADSPGRTTAQVRTRRNNTNLLLWTLQGWLAMFYIGTGYAKISEPLESLALLMDWPRLAGPDLVQLLGLADIGLASGMLLPLISWKIGRPACRRCMEPSARKLARVTASSRRQMVMGRIWQSSQGWPTGSSAKGPLA